MYATHDPRRAETWSYLGKNPICCTWWQYEHMRAATHADLHVSPRCRSGRHRTKTRSLVGALHRSDTALRWIMVPGPFFDLADGVGTPFLGPKSHRRFAEAKSWVDAHHPDAVWLVWTGRQPVDPVTLERIDPPFDSEPDVERMLGIR